ncbi:MAG: hypothetical protein WAM14_08055 [Candidatus Nitrosopolaris sp.]
MAGFTVSGIESETSYLERTWPLFTGKELMDNPYDWFNEVYPNSPKHDRKISFRVWPFERGIRIVVRNSICCIGNFTQHHPYDPYDHYYRYSRIKVNV